MAERYIRTLKTILYKFFEEHRTFKYVHLLPKLASLVKRRYNRAISMPAANVTAKDVPKLIALQFEKSKTRPQKPQFEVSDRIRIALKNVPFRKGYKPQYTNEVFKVNQVCKPTKIGLATITDWKLSKASQVWEDFTPPSSLISTIYRIGAGRVINVS